MIDFRVFLSAPFLFIAVLVNIISFKTFVFISLFILCIAVLFEKWSSSGLRAVERRQKKRLKNDEKEQLSISNGMFSNMFFNRSFQEKSKTNKNNTSSTWKMGSTSPHVPTDSRIRNRCAVSRNHSFSGRRSDFNASRITDNHLKYIPFLPTVRRALGLDNVQNSPLPKTPEVAATYPERPVAGFLPAVRLGRRELPRFSPASRSLGRSPNTVKIAPPDPRRIYNTRLFQVKNNQREENRTSTPNTQSVLSALKEKSRKRTMDGVDVTISDVQGQMAKRRRQESQQSNASTSSLPSLPDNLPDLSTQGYTIPRLRTPTLKRSINMANLTDLDWEDSESGNIKKRPRHEAHYNSISSSLSSMRRMRIKQAVNKRKNESKENSLVEDGSGRSSPVMKKAMLQSADTIVLPENKDVPSPTYVTKDETSKSQLSELETSVADFLNKSGSTQKAVRTPKRVALTEKLSARKRDMSLYAGLNKTYENVPQANISAKIEDYDQDREEEEKRVQDLMSEIGEPEKDSGATSVVSSTSVLTTAASIPSQAATSSPSITLGSTKPVSNSDSTSTPASSAPSLVSASVSASTPSPGLFVTSAAVSTTSVSPVSKPLSTTGFTFSGFSSGANGMSSMVSLSSGTTTVTSAAGTIASASPFNLGTTSTSVAKTSPLTGFQVEQKTSKAESSLSESSSAPATFTQPGTLFSGSSSSTVSSTSAPPPPYFGGQTAAFASSPVGQGGLNSAVQTAKSSSVTSVLPSEGIKGGFSFGGQTTSPATTVTTAATSASVGGFAFGGQSQSVLAPVSTEATSTSKVGGFSFGGQTSIAVTAVSNVASSTSAVGGFDFGGTTTTGAITSSANGGFNFGSQSSTAPSAASAGGFSFNSQSSNATRASAPGGFNFGTTATSTLAGSNVAFSFGAGKDSSAASTSNSFMNKPSALVASASNANTVASTTPAPGGFNFGAQPTSSNGTKGFNFASQNPGSAPKPATTTAAGVFAFGGQNASTAVSPSSGGFNFASGSTAPAGVFNFGTNKPATTTSGMFNPTSTTKQASTVFAFGAGAQNSTTPSSTSFGQQPAGSQPSSTFAFGQSTTTAGSVFGQPTVTQPTPVFGQSSTQPFGQNPQSQPPPYGSTTGFGQQAGSQTTTGFGQTSQSTSGFGQNASGPTFGQQPSAQPTFNFGQQNPNTQAAPAFGQTATQPSFAFGQQASCQPQTNTVFSFGQQTAPAFEQSTSASSFTKSASTPAFGSTNGNTGFNFGTTTPLKNSQSSAPSSGFSFGTPQNNSATPNHSTPANQGKGFDFSGSLTPSGSFNFGAGGNTFGTPGGSSASQPNFASTPSFNVGAGSNPQKPRQIRKPVRRTKR